MDVEHCAEHTVALLKSAGHTELAMALYRQLREKRRDRPTVVVVGETKRGKSSVVNMLLGRPGLSPVDVDVATCVHLNFHFDTRENAHVVVAGEPDPIEIAVADIAAWASEAANPGNAKASSASKWACQRRCSRTCA